MKRIYIFCLVLCIALYNCGKETKPTPSAKAPIDGKAIYRKNCVLCHGIDGKLQFNTAKDLSKSVISHEERVLQITNGKGLMTPFSGILTEKEIKAVADYTRTLNPELK